MTSHTPPLKQSLALLTDLYELTMAYGYWKLGRAEEDAAFHLFFRKNPFEGGYTIAAGLAYVVGFLEQFRFEDDDLDYLASLEGNDGKPLFDRGFMDHLRRLELACDIDAVPEGTVVFPHEPLARVTGPIIQCQILETALLNMLNFQSLIATKASRICAAADGEPVLEFGLRRAQGIDGGLAASRAAYIGGCSATSNVLAGRYYGIPVKGTIAHSWVMAFPTERESFEAYASAMPNNCVFLVDTYDSLEGVANAIAVGRQLRERGHELVGIRLDSGDLAYLSTQARRMLDEAGFEDAKIVASNDLDEHIIENLHQQQAKVNVWGVGTKLATAYDQPALGGVYKLSAIRAPGEDWQPRIKLSEQTVKVSNPGRQQVRRFQGSDHFIADMIYEQGIGVNRDEQVIIDPLDATRRKRIRPETPYEDLLVPITRGGRLAYDTPPLESSRQRTADQLAMLHPAIRRLLNPHTYPAGLEKRLHELKTSLILEARGVDVP